MSAIHFVERKGNFRKLREAEGEWEAGYWVVAESTAGRLVGGDLYLHRGQKEPSYFGGRVLGWRVHRDGSDLDGRLVFRIRAAENYKGVVTGREGWGNEKKVVW